MTRRKSWSLAMLTVAGSVISTNTFAAGLERSDQSISNFFQPDNYVEIGANYISPTIKSRIRDGYQAPGSLRDAQTQYFNHGGSLGDMGKDDWFMNGTVKLQLTDQISAGMLWDQPWGSNTGYSNEGPRNPQGYGLLTNPDGSGSSSRVLSNNFTFLVGYQPTKNWEVYAGPVMETSKSFLRLRGVDMGMENGYAYYDYNTKTDHAWGWLAGVSYQIPELAMRASLTYRSAINHRIKTNENGTSMLWALGNSSPIADFDVDSKLSFKSPQNINLELQTGIAPHTLVFASVRWVNWKQSTSNPEVFSRLTKAQGAATTMQNLGIAQMRQAQAMGMLPAGAKVPQPYTNYNPKGYKMVDYYRDEWAFKAGVGYQFSDEWSGMAYFGHDNGTGKTATLLGPVNGSWDVGVGVKYEPKNTGLVLQGGFAYYWMHNARGQLASAHGSDDYSTEARHNHTIGAGFKIGYRF